MKETKLALNLAYETVEEMEFMQHVASRADDSPSNRDILLQSKIGTTSKIGTSSKPSKFKRSTSAIVVSICALLHNFLLKYDSSRKVVMAWQKHTKVRMRLRRINEGVTWRLATETLGRWALQTQIQVATTATNQDKEYITRQKEFIILMQQQDEINFSQIIDSLSQKIYFLQDILEKSTTQLMVKMQSHRQLSIQHSDLKSEYVKSRSLLGQLTADKVHAGNQAKCQAAKLDSALAMIQSKNDEILRLRAYCSDLVDLLHQQGIKATRANFPTANGNHYLEAQPLLKDISKIAPSAPAPHFSISRLSPSNAQADEIYSISQNNFDAHASFQSHVTNVGDRAARINSEIILSNHIIVAADQEHGSLHPVRSEDIKENGRYKASLPSPHTEMGLSLHASNETGRIGNNQFTADSVHGRSHSEHRPSPLDTSVNASQNFSWEGSEESLQEGSKASERCNGKETCAIFPIGEPDEPATRRLIHRLGGAPRESKRFDHTSQALGKGYAVRGGIRSPLHAPRATRTSELRSRSVTPEQRESFARERQIQQMAELAARQLQQNNHRYRRGT